MSHPNGTSVIGGLQQEALATAANLDVTAAGIRQFIDPLKACWAHMQAAMAHTHQQDVPEMGQIVEGSIVVLGGCADKVTISAHKIREIEART